MRESIKYIQDAFDAREQGVQNTVSAWVIAMWEEHLSLKVDTLEQARRQTRPAAPCRSLPLLALKTCGFASSLHRTP